MYSYSHFRPGATRTDTSRLIHYVTEYNGGAMMCGCIPDKYDKNTPGSDAASTRVSKAMKLAQILTASKGGRVHYGNTYLGKPVSVNYLGRMEGMPGGSGSPPVNRF